MYLGKWKRCCKAGLSQCFRPVVWRSENQCRRRHIRDRANRSLRSSSRSLLHTEAQMYLGKCEALLLRPGFVTMFSA